MLIHYLGSTFQFAGALQADGLPYDFTGWNVTAQLRNKAGTTLISNLIFTWLDATKGLLTITSPVDTSNWPPGIARIDCAATTPVGETIKGPPTYVRLQQSPVNS